MSRTVLFDPKLALLLFSPISKHIEFFHFQSFRDVLVRKEQQQPLSCSILSEHVVRIKSKTHKVWTSYAKQVQYGSYETGDSGLKAPPPRLERVNKKFDFLVVCKYGKLRVNFIAFAVENTLCILLDFWPNVQFSLKQQIKFVLRRIRRIDRKILRRILMVV